ncbi:hypothetical protein C9J85_18755 [Haloferax sp. wsp5]|nr:hypothetical protein C9J85_18755 [Haloferax sp. wsp5]
MPEDGADARRRVDHFRGVPVAEVPRRGRRRPSLRANVRELTRRYETFERMADAFEMDVTDETVRRYMIDQGRTHPVTSSVKITRLSGQPLTTAIRAPNFICPLRVRGGNSPC